MFLPSFTENSSILLRSMNVSPCFSTTLVHFYWSLRLCLVIFLPRLYRLVRIGKQMCNQWCPSVATGAKKKQEKPARFLFHMAVVDWRVDFEGDSCALAVGNKLFYCRFSWHSVRKSTPKSAGNSISRVFFLFFFHATGFEGETPERMPSGPWQTKIKNKTKTNRFPSRRRASADSTKRPQESPRTVVTWKSTLESVWDSTLTRRCVSAAKCVENGNVGSSRL